MGPKKHHTYNPNLYSINLPTPTPTRMTCLRQNTMLIMRMLRELRMEMYSESCTDNRAQELRPVIHKLERLLGLPLTTFGRRRRNAFTPRLRAFRKLPGT